MCDSEEENRQDMLREEHESDQRANNIYDKHDYLEGLKCKHNGCEKYLPGHPGTESFNDSEICFNPSHRTPEDDD